MKVGTGVFSATHPRVGPKLLAPQQAQVAKNCDLRSGELRPLKATSSVTVINSGPTVALDSGTVKSIFLYENQYLWSWDDIVNIVRGPVKGDTYGRVYWTGDTADSTRPKMGYLDVSVVGTPPVRYPAASYRLGIPKPAAAPTLTATGAGGCATADQTTRVYVYTYVSGLGEEGPPSSQTSVVICPGQGVDLSAMSTGPAGSYNITHKNIYRTNTGTSSTEYQFVAQIAVATATYSDAIADTALGEVCPSKDWIAPVDGLRGLTELSNGMLAGFDSASPKDVWISEPFVPHAWPHRKAINHKVVGLCSFGTSLVAMTEGFPYIATGSDPTALSLEPINLAQACVSARGISRFGDAGVIYPSADGLVLVTPGGAQVITEELLTAKEWAAYKPDSIHGYVIDGQYIGFYDTGTATGGFIFNMKSNLFIDITTYATAGYVDVKTGSLYLIVSGALVKWEGNSTLLTHTWRSKKYEIGDYTNFPLGQVIAKSYVDVTMKVYADGTLKHTQTVTSIEPFKLPSGFLAQDWEFELSGTDIVTSAYLAESVEDLARGA